MPVDPTEDQADVFLAALEEVTQSEPHSASGTVATLIGATHRQELANALARGRFNLDIVGKENRLSVGINYILTAVISTEKFEALAGASKVVPRIDSYSELMLTQVFLTCILTDNKSAMMEIAQKFDLLFIFTYPDPYRLMYDYIDSGVDLPFSWWLKLEAGEQP